MPIIDEPEIKEEDIVNEEKKEINDKLKVDEEFKEKKYIKKENNNTLINKILSIFKCCDVEKFTFYKVEKMCFIYVIQYIIYLAIFLLFLLIILNLNSKIMT